jgi:transposase
LRSGQLKGIYIPPKESQRDRSLVRQRYQYASDERKLKNRIKSHLEFYGIKTADDIDDRYWSRRYIQSLNDIAQRNGDMVLASYLEKLSLERKFVLESLRQLRNLSKQKRYLHKSILLMSIPGVGLLTTMVYLTEIGPVDRFKTDDQYLAYIGLIPGSRSSGEKERTGPLSNRGNKRIRTALILSAWVSIRNSPAMAMKYEEYRKKGKIANKAIVKIASKLALIMKAVLRDEKKYNEVIN